MSAPERIWFAPDDGEISRDGWSGVCSGTDRLYWEAKQAHAMDDDGVEYIRADLYDALLARHEAALEALESLLNAATGPDYIFREQQAIDGLPGAETVFSKARAALSGATSCLCIQPRCGLRA